MPGRNRPGPRVIGLEIIGFAFRRNEMEGVDNSIRLVCGHNDFSNKWSSEDTDRNCGKLIFYLSQCRDGLVNWTNRYGGTDLDGQTIGLASKTMAVTM